MTFIRIFGAVLILCGSAGFGFGAAWQMKRTVSQLEMLGTAMHLMECELSFISPPLPRLMRTVSKDTQGAVSVLFANYAKLLSNPATRDTEEAMRKALEMTKRLSLPSGTVFSLLEFSQTLGRYDLPGQLSALASARSRLSGQLEHLRSEQKDRCRTYQTLGICAGLAVVILIL
ncbi:MAG: stage III sporulation protein AB [Clostridia bacterium]|nr:stage III sporulation protein AB [Clostridia bacterium]